jgi:isopentenyldiphosphate isomerase
MKVSEELLDVVDENDSLVEVKTRGEIHARGLIHRAVHILVFNNRGDLFIQKRSMNKDENPGLWDSSAAGHVDSGEDYLQCALREITEELGIVVEGVLQALFKLPASAATGYEHSLIYRYDFDGPLILQKDEIDEGRWISPEHMDQSLEARDPGMTESLQLIWQGYRDLHRDNS